MDTIDHQLSKIGVIEIGRVSHCRGKNPSTTRVCMGPSDRIEGLFITTRTIGKNRATVDQDIGTLGGIIGTHMIGPGANVEFGRNAVQNWMLADSFCIRACVVTVVVNPWCS